jgi:hypothetical protein
MSSIAIMVVLIAGLVIAVVTAGSAVVANRVSPQRPTYDLAMRVSFWVGAAVVGLMITTMIIFLAQSCPEGLACDAGAMAAAGAVALGSTVVVLDVIIGLPVAILTLHLLRRK